MNKASSKLHGRLKGKLAETERCGQRTKEYKPTSEASKDVSLMRACWSCVSRSLPIASTTKSIPISYNVDDAKLDDAQLDATKLQHCGVVATVAIHHRSTRTLQPCHRKRKNGIDNDASVY